MKDPDFIVVHNNGLLIMVIGLNPGTQESLLVMTLNEIKSHPVFSKKFEEILDRMNTEALEDLEDLESLSGDLLELDKDPAQTLFSFKELNHFLNNHN